MSQNTKFIGISRYLNETEFCRSDEQWHYLTLHPTSCNNCSNLISCEECVNATTNCEWWTDDARCARRGRSDKAARVLGECPAPCWQRESCGSCLDQPGRCVW